MSVSFRKLVLSNVRTTEQAVGTSSISTPQLVRARLAQLIAADNAGGRQQRDRERERKERMKFVSHERSLLFTTASIFKNHDVNL